MMADQQLTADAPAAGAPGRRARWRQAGVLTMACVLAAGVAAAVLAVVLSGQRPAASQAGGTPVATAPVVRTTLTNSVQIAGSLGYAGSVTIADQAQGTAYTALPQPGQVIRRGERLYEVDGTAVVLFYGGRPAWRELSAGVADGPDVGQLDRNLIALGYASPATLTVSDVFTVATADAVERWQAGVGLPVTGTVPLGQVVFAPGPLRLTSLTAVLGATAQAGGTVLTATSPDPVVTADLPVGQEYLVERGDPVSVTLPDGTTTAPGVITSVSRVASATGNNAPAGPSAGASPGGSADGSPSGGGSGGSAPTVLLTVRLAHPRVAGHLDQAPVTVNIVSARARHVLAVPVNALVALAGGGYAVEVPQGRSLRLVSVHTGLFSSTLVQVSGAGLHPGSRVEVPAS
jgi:peptidoglycan hydrolase-like protein with peptidoglycan-binding domain